jgi:hypothetical protein
MDVGRMASLYITGTEAQVRGNAMVYVLSTKLPIDRVRLAASYHALVVANEELRLKWVETPETQGFAWVPFTAQETSERLTRERDAMAAYATPDEIHAEYSPTNERFPFRVAVADDRTLLVVVNHAWCNGYGGLFWIEHLFRVYGGDTDAIVPSEAAPRASAAVRLARAIAGAFWAIVYLVGFALRAGKDAATQTVDLARSAPTEPSSCGYALRTYRFTFDETKRLVARAKERKLSVAANLVADFAQALLEAQPERSRVCMSLPVDLAPYIDGFSRKTPGNFTGSLILQVRRGADVAAQVRRGFRGFARGVPYWVTRILASFSKSERAARERFSTQARSTNASRAPFENFSIAVSCGGVLRGPELQKYAATFEGSTRTQTIYVGAATLNGRLSFKVSVPKDLFDEREVFAVTDRAHAMLLGAELVREEAGLAVANA